MIELTALHWIYLVFILAIIGVMIMKRDTTIVSILGIFTLEIIATASLTSAITGVFNSFVYAITQLLGTILVISIIVAMSYIMTKTGINDVMIKPFTKLIKTSTLAFLITGWLLSIEVNPY